MPTTIQIHEETLELLKKLRKPIKASSYDEVIVDIIKKATKPTDSLYGFLGKKSMKEILRGLRDEENRI